MDRGMISRRYARTLFMYAQKKECEEQIYNEATLLNQCFTQFPALRRVLSNLMLTTEQREEVIHTALGGKPTEAFMKFIHLVFFEKREDFLQEICLSYLRIYREEKDLISADLITAVPLDEETEQKILKRIESLTKSTVTLNIRVNPAIIGGYIIRWDSIYRLDASVASKLKRIKKILTEKE
jgi:F-type H+-transporting ATPase subunit delta